MGVLVLTGANSPKVTINSVDLSDHCSSCKITQSADDVDITSFGASAHQHAPGLRDDSFEFTMFQDFATGKVDATLSPLLGVAAGTLVEVVVTNATVTSQNPKYSGTCVLLEYSALDASVGDASEITVTFAPALAGSIVRGTV